MEDKSKPKDISKWYLYTLQNTQKAITQLSFAAFNLAFHDYRNAQVDLQNAATEIDRAIERLRGR